MSLNLEELLRAEGGEVVTITEAFPAADERPIAWFQFRAAFAVAKAFGHEWTFGTPDDDASVLAFYHRVHDGDPAVIAEHTRARRGNSAPGIEAPILVEGIVVHETGTGRLKWMVYTGGVVTVIVSRQSGPVLRVMHYQLADGPYLEAERVGSAKIGMRHLTAAYRVFAALGRGEEAFVALHGIAVDEQ